MNYDKEISLIDYLIEEAKVIMELKKSYLNKKRYQKKKKGLPTNSSKTDLKEINSLKRKMTKLQAKKEILIIKKNKALQRELFPSKQQEYEEYRYGKSSRS